MSAPADAALRGEPRPAEAAPASGASRAILAVLFAAYLVLLVWIILFKLEPPHIGVDRQLKLVPFARTAAAGPSAPLEVVANLLLFAPFGAYLGLLAPRWEWWRRIGAVAAVSGALEIAQYVLGVGRTDVTDVIVNTAGGIAGLALWAVCRGTTRRGLAIAVVVATLGMILLAAAFIASPLRFR